MKKHTSVMARTTMALDVSDECIQICVLNEAGEIIEEGRQRSHPRGSA